MIEMQTTCRTCGESWTPAHAAYVRGDWRTCTRCRGDPGEEASGVILDDSRTAQGNTAPRYGQVGEKGREQ